MPKYHYLFTVDAQSQASATEVVSIMLGQANEDCAWWVNADHIDGDGAYEVEGEGEEEEDAEERRAWLEEEHDRAVTQMKAKAEGVR